MIYATYSHGSTFLNLTVTFISCGTYPPSFFTPVDDKDEDKENQPKEGDKDAGYAEPNKPKRATKKATAPCRLLAGVVYGGSGFPDAQVILRGFEMKVNF